MVHFASLPQRLLSRHGAEAITNIGLLVLYIVGMFQCLEKAGNMNRKSYPSLFDCIDCIWEGGSGGCDMDLPLPVLRNDPFPTLCCTMHVSCHRSHRCLVLFSTHHVDTCSSKALKTSGHHM